MNDPNDQFQDEYLNQKKDRTEQEQLTKQERLNQELRTLPEGEALFDWICKHVEKGVGDPVMWQYVDTGRAQQNRSNRIHLMNGRTHQVIQTIEVNRQEIAQVRSTGESWINQLLMTLEGDQGHASQMHEKFEDDLSSRYEEMMDKLTGNNQ